MKRRIVALMLLIIVLVTSCFVYSYFNSIKDLFYSFKYSTEEIETIVTDSNEKLKSQIEELVGEPMREFTEKENLQIEKGEVTKKEIIEKILKEELLDKTKTDSKTAAKQENLSQIYIAELYDLKTHYIGLLDSMVDSAVKEYKSLDKKQRTKTKQLEIGAEYAKRALSLEKECDTKVDALIKKIEQQLKAEGKNTEIVDTLKSTYDSEKRMKKVYYLNMFKK